MNSAAQAPQETVPVSPLPPLARFRGEPLFELPRDLYIPPEALEVFLEAFEGPLDLLLYLIRKNNLDVLNIPMAELTRQYAEYVEAMRSGRLELAAEYLLMAALLVEIKSRMLLPLPVSSREEEDRDPRAELVRRLLEYERMKQAAQNLNQLPQLGRDFLPVLVWVDRAAAPRLPDVHPEDLRQAWLALVARARAFQHHRISREQLSVRERMSQVLRRLRGEGFLPFMELFEPVRGVPELVVTFLAILELSREGLIQVAQEAPYLPIYVRLAHGSDLIPLPA